MGIEVDDTDPHRRAAGDEAKEAAPGRLVATTQDDGPLARGHERGYVPRKALLCALEIAVGAGDVAGVPHRQGAVPGEVGQRPAQGLRPRGRTGPTLVAAHALVAGKAQQCYPSGSARDERADHLVPAQGRWSLARVHPALPGPGGAHDTTSPASTRCHRRGAAGS